MTSCDRWYQQDRLGGLRRFATAITVLNILGHTVLGFEQSWAHPLVALVTAYTMELLLEWVDARLSGRSARFAGGPRKLVDFLLSAHISAMAVSMLLYSNERLMPIVFGSAAAIASKTVLRLRDGNGSRHFMNPSNFGITLTLLLFPWVGIAPPYQFTAGLGALGDWILPLIIICSGTFLNRRFTRRVPLLAAWVVGFIVQAAFRHLSMGASFEAALVPMSGMAFLLFTFYMVTDPATTPSDRKAQIIFGASVAAAYGVLMASHIVFGLFFSLTAVTVLRAAGFAVRRLFAGAQRPVALPVPVPAPTLIGSAAEVLPQAPAAISGGQR